jgi:multidrug resistance efflux pump
MSRIESKSQLEKTGLHDEVTKARDPTARAVTLQVDRRILRLLITFATVAATIWLGRAMWDASMVAPWTRDGTVRAYIVTMAPEVKGHIVELPPVD